jgi:serine/threonine protein kinase/formylglycine-generating enzyme required for sulfatase activity
MESSGARPPSPESAPAEESPYLLGSPSDFESAVLERLRERGRAPKRYSIRQEIGRGGMGRVLSARDDDLRRDVAMKVMREDLCGGPESSSLRSLRLARFLEEAQVTGQLDHPGIVPVHELGVDEQGRVYFTMKLVRGEDLGRVIEHARAGRDGWTETRIMGVLLRVCEAMAYAHSKGVIHRDLKPSNIRVGRYGAVYVMDWGLARVNGRSDERDLRVRELAPSAASEPVVSERALHAQGESPLHTMDGTPIGTPMFMSPEQALGELHRLGSTTDVYGVGAILYTVLTGQMPYLDPQQPLDGLAIVRKIRAGAPRSVFALAPNAAPELAAICEKAMRRDPNERYANMEELAEELRAYLEQRVVRAHRTGPWRELVLWSRRNRAVAVSLTALAAAILAGAVGIAYSESRRSAEADFRADALAAAELVREAAWVGPCDSRGLGALEQWKSAAEELIVQRASLETEVARTRNELLARSSAYENRGGVRAEMDERVREAQGWVREFEDVLAQARRALDGKPLEGDRVKDPAEAARILPTEIEYWRTRVGDLMAEAPPYRPLEETRAGVLDGYVAQERLLRDLLALERAVPKVERRLELARTIRKESIEAPAAARAWSEAIASIKDSALCPAYAGRITRLSPVEGLVPLRRNSRNGLWEFHHLASGAAPRLDEKGEWVIGADTGIVFVLLPGGDSLIGAQAGEPQSARFDPVASKTEAPWRAELEPFFIAAHEVTQGQWLRMEGGVPSLCATGRQLNPDPRVTRSHPVESVDAHESAHRLELFGLSLPTEAQWEYAARGGSDAVFVFGDEAAALAGRANAKRGGAEDPRDLYARTAPVGVFAPNAYGLYDVLGNVGEWCADAISDSQDRPSVEPRTGLREPQRPRDRVVRGGSYDTTPDQLRASARRGVHPSNADRFVGVRPVRTLE